MNYIDLGLPSGNLWADCNIGANEPLNSGTYYTCYTIDEIDIDNIPTEDDFQELLDNCHYLFFTKNGIDVYRFTGPNGNCIYLPATSFMYNGVIQGAAKGTGFYLTSTPIFDGIRYLYFTYKDIKICSGFKHYGRCIRTIKRTNLINNKMKPITPKKVKENFELPDMAISIVNRLITEYFSGSESIFTKEMLIRSLLECGFNNSAIDSILIKMPKIYRQSGWDIQESENGYVFQEQLN